MRKCLVTCCICLLAFSTVSISNAKADRFGRTVARSFTRTINQTQRNYRQTSRAYDRVYHSPSRYSAVSRSRSYAAPVYYGPSHRSYYRAPAYRAPAYRAPVYRSGIYLGSPRGGFYLNF